jgi:hypothetical protein
MNTATQIFMSDNILRTAWATQQYYRHLGFPADNIWVTWDDKDDIFVGLRDIEGVENPGSIRIGHHSHLELFKTYWVMVGEAYMNGELPINLLQATWNESPFVRMPGIAIDIIMKLVAAGIEVPVLAGKEDTTQITAIVKGTASWIN